MTKLARVALIGNYLPRRCGIATFTHDLHRAISISSPDLETSVVAMTDSGRSYDYPPDAEAKAVELVLEQAELFAHGEVSTA